jgi:hypothetical protein
MSVLQIVWLEDIPKFGEEGRLRWKMNELHSSAFDQAVGPLRSEDPTSMPIPILLRRCDSSGQHLLEPCRSRRPASHPRLQERRSAAEFAPHYVDAVVPYQEGVALGFALKSEESLRQRKRVPLDATPLT